MYRVFILVLSCVLLIGAGQVFAAEQRVELSVDIKNMILDLSCDSSKDCKSFGFGSRECGGYQEYLIYSAKNLDEQNLLSKADTYFNLDKQYNIDNQMGSICSVEQPRVVECQQNKCVDMGDILNYSPVLE